MESVKESINVYNDPVGVLTNNPPFDMQMFRLNDFRGLSPKQPENTFSDKLDLTSYSRGMGAMGLPGDLSSQSRFVRAAFVKMNSRSSPDEQSSVSQFFHILNSVDQQRGCCEVAESKYEITIYTAAAILTRAFTIIPPTTDIRYPLLICTKKTLIPPSLLPTL